MASVFFFSAETWIHQSRSKWLFLLWIYFLKIYSPSINSGSHRQWMAVRIIGMPTLFLHIFCYKLSFITLSTIFVNRVVAGLLERQTLQWYIQTLFVWILLGWPALFEFRFMCSDVIFTRKINGRAGCPERSKQAILR